MGEYGLLRIQLLRTLIQMEEELLTGLIKESNQPKINTEIKNGNLILSAENNQVKAVLSVQELSKYLGVSTDCIYTMVRENQIPFVRVRKRILFQKESINAWLHVSPNK